MKLKKTSGEKKTQEQEFLSITERQLLYEFIATIIRLNSARTNKERLLFAYRPAKSGYVSLSAHWNYFQLG
jgi:hypothetical protein